MILDNKKKCFIEFVDKHLYKLFALAIILIPLNMVPWFSFLGELGEKGSLYPFYLIIPILSVYVLLTKKYYKIQDISIKMYLCFLIITIISIVFNFNDILMNIFKGRTGIEKLILQFTIVIFVSLVMYSSYYIMILNKISFENIRKWIFISFIICGIYSFFEVLTLDGIIDFSIITNLISNIVHKYTRGEVYYRGVRSLSGEASFFGMYVAFCLPWILSYIFTKKKNIWYILGFMYLLILSLLTKSRLALVIVYFQLFLFIILYILKINKSKENSKKLCKFIIGIVLAIVISSGVYTKVGYDKNGNAATSVSITKLIQSLTDPDNYSNIARIGLMKGALNMGIANPIIGVGLGQYGFNIDNYLDDDARVSYEVQNWTNPEIEDWPPSFSIHLRILAEQGIVGFVLWCSIWISLFVRVWKKWKNNNEDYDGICLLVSMSGIIISGFNIDSYAYFPYYLVLIMSILYLKNEKSGYCIDNITDKL